MNDLALVVALLLTGLCMMTWASGIASIFKTSKVNDVAIERSKHSQVMQNNQMDGVGGTATDDSSVCGQENHS